MKVLIYTLTCPITNDIRYVGKTDGELKTRLSAHISAPTSRLNRKWILILKGFNLKPIIECIDITDDKNAESTEQYWIDQLRSWGYVLHNVDKYHNYVGNTPKDKLPKIAIKGFKLMNLQ